MVCPTGLEGSRFFFNGSPNAPGGVSYFFFNGLPNVPPWGFVFKYWFAQRVWRGSVFQVLACQRARHFWLSTGLPNGSGDSCRVF